ncbi:hypothetical protein [Nocardia sp. NPDC046763]|uniref:hypothetical protein n=1 Tax=Nocardia sp. NPDC046763 TaxID=3155256 RepID=UPI0033DBB5EF
MTGPHHDLPIPAKRPALRVLHGSAGRIHARVLFVYTRSWIPDPVTAILVDRVYPSNAASTEPTEILQAIRFLHGARLGPITGAHRDWIAQQKSASLDLRYRLQTALVEAGFDVEVVQTWDEALRPTSHQHVVNP